jgi:hypothetical protein
MAGCGQQNAGRYCERDFQRLMNANEMTRQPDGIYDRDTYFLRFFHDLTRVKGFRLHTRY